MSQNYKLAVVGNASSVLLYKALGCETHAVYNLDEARDTSEELFRAVHDDANRTPQYAVIFVEESYYKEFPEDLIEKFARKALPAVIPVPSPGESSDDFASQRLRKIVERAVGSDILG